MSGDLYDVIVLGGGPAGSTLVSFLAMGGSRVLLLERETFPRHQIGESLLPATVHGICRLLGVFDELERQGFPRKNGGTFRWGTNPEPWTFRFSKRPDDPFGYAFQVERAKFDQILLNRARALGVDVREEHHAKSAIVKEGRVTGVVYLDGAGREQTARALCRRRLRQPQPALADGGRAGLACEEDPPHRGEVERRLRAPGGGIGRRGRAALRPRGLLRGPGGFRLLVFPERPAARGERRGRLGGPRTAAGPGRGGCGRGRGVFQPDAVHARLHPRAHRAPDPRHEPGPPRRRAPRPQGRPRALARRLPLEAA